MFSSLVYPAWLYQQFDIVSATIAALLLLLLLLLCIYWWTQTLTNFNLTNNCNLLLVYLA